MADDRDDFIQSEAQARHVIEEMAANPKTTEKRHRYNHLDIASQGIKMINSAVRDPFVRKVMTLRIMGPAITGRERSYVSIALELGAHVNDVKAAEAYGVKLIEELMKKVELPEFIGRYNSKRAVDTAVTEMRESTKQATSE